VFGKRAKDEPAQLLTPALINLVAVATVEVAAKQNAAIERWGLGSSDRWSADLGAGTISFHFGDRVLTGPVQMLGSYSRESGTWLWGWAVESFATECVQPPKRPGRSRSPTLRSAPSPSGSSLGRNPMEMTLQP
jgi:hypothetical protein